jgi:hypothetical protein
MAMWYLTRGTGAAALVLLTLTLVLGVVDVERFTSPRFPRFVVDGWHRTVALLVCVLLAIHIGTTVLDGYAPIRVVDAVVPFVSVYRRSRSTSSSRWSSPACCAGASACAPGEPSTGRPMPAGRWRSCTASAPAATCGPAG